MNPYETLGVDQDADADDVKEAYRDLAKEHHPDRGGDEEKFKEIQEAYEQITSEGGEGSRRRGFDGQSPFAGARATQGFDFGGKNKGVEDFVRDFHEFASQGGFERGGFQGSPFGGSRVHQQIVYELPVDFKTAVYGKKAQVQVPDRGEEEIEIPPGVQNGTKLNYGGDLTVKFRISENDTEFWRQNKNDLWTIKKISALDAMIGENLEVETLDGQKVRLKLDPGTSPGQTYRLEGFGGPPTFDGQSQGDMYVEISMDVPAVTEKENVELIEKLR